MSPPNPKDRGPPYQKEKKSSGESTEKQKKRNAKDDQIQFVPLTFVNINGHEVLVLSLTCGVEANYYFCFLQPSVDGTASKTHWAEQYVVRGVWGQKGREAGVDPATRRMGWSSGAAEKWQRKANILPS